MESRPGDARRRHGGRARPDEPTPRPPEATGGRDQPRPPRRRPPEQGPGAGQRRRPRRPAPDDRAGSPGSTPPPRRRPTPDDTDTPPPRRRPATSPPTAARGASGRRRPDTASTASDEIHTSDRRNGAPPRRRRPAGDAGRDPSDPGKPRRRAGSDRRAQPDRGSRPGGAADPDERPRASRPGAAGTTGRSRLSWRPRTSRAGIGRGLVALLSASVLLCTGYAWNNVNNLNSNITQLGGLELGGADDGAVDILLVGTDSRTDAKGNPLSADELRLLRSGQEVATNTDTILLIRIPNDGSSATAISVPRDSYVEVPGIGMSKINAAYGTTKEGVRQRAVESGESAAAAEEEGTQAGRKALIDSVAGLTGVHVDHYAEVGLLGFVLLTNAVGGVDVCLTDAVNDPYSGARFRAGEQTLNGPKALSFVRQRHGLPRGDLDRITRQQVFMASLANKMLSANMLADPGKLAELQRAVSRSVVIDDNWDVVKLAEQLKDLSGGRVKFATIPVVTEQGWSEDGQQSVVEVDPTEVRTFTDNLLNRKQEAGTAERADYTVDVVNAGTIDGLAANVANILTTKGFQSGETVSGSADDRDTVVYTHAEDAGARQLATDLGGAEVRVDSSLPENRLKAVLTNTYEGPGSILDTGTQVDNIPASERVGNNRPPITAGTDGPTCVN
ncbi:LytR family transcriptional regulator [Gordonia sp. HNM0687]|uniref:LytR family transcriptional regulator n=1 Tax=Gordonia mangrovi TaxID=2665643 RepID=A0A6L7GT05_9ACTN|nr:LytR family transcriptional regulator [Gordonia mangrovi]UVF77428.1 LCP family protein [Gordonia mangrovi]